WAVRCPNHQRCLRRRRVTPGLSRGEVCALVSVLSSREVKGGSGAWRVLEKEPRAASVPCPGINPGRPEERRVGKGDKARGAEREDRKKLTSGRPGRTGWGERDGTRTNLVGYSARMESR